MGNNPSIKKFHKDVDETGVACYKYRWHASCCCFCCGPPAFKMHHERGIRASESASFQEARAVLEDALPDINAVVRSTVFTKCCVSGVNVRGIIRRFRQASEIIRKEHLVAVNQQLAQHGYQAYMRCGAYQTMAFIWSTGEHFQHHCTHATHERPYIAIVFFKAQPQTPLKRVHTQTEHVVHLKVPPGVQAGQTISFVSPDGDEMTAQVPEGLQPGNVFDVTI